MKEQSLLSGKKLLVLGSTQSVYDVVSAARRMGAYVVVTDISEDGMSRRLADEALSISTTDFEALIGYVRTHGIDGVFTGASEFNIQNMITLCERAGLRCYCSQAQWDATQNKRIFKDACRACGITVVPEFDLMTPEGRRGISYPMIVKPTDSCSSKGISVCSEQSQLQQAIDYANEFSNSRSVIAEQLMSCDSIIAYYTIQNGYVSLSAVGDWYKYNNRYGIAAITSAIVFPSVRTEKFRRATQEPMKKLFEYLGITNGVFCLQGFMDEDSVYAYEACFRICGTQEYNIISKVNGINSLDMMIQYALCGEFGSGNEAEELDDASFAGKSACNLAIMLNSGRIADIRHFDELYDICGVTHISAPRQIGDVVAEDDIGTLQQTFTRVDVVSDSEDSLKEAIIKIFDTIEITDDSGKNMLAPMPQALKEWLYK